jgi:hypothetical protein
MLSSTFSTTWSVFRPSCPILWTRSQCHNQYQVLSVKVSADLTLSGGSRYQQSTLSSGLSRLRSSQPAHRMWRRLSGRLHWLIMTARLFGRHHGLVLAFCAAGFGSFSVFWSKSGFWAKCASVVSGSSETSTCIFGTAEWLNWMISVFGRAGLFVIRSTIHISYCFARLARILASISPAIGGFPDLVITVRLTTFNWDQILQSVNWLLKFQAHLTSKT